MTMTGCPSELVQPWCQIAVRWKRPHGRIARISKDFAPSCFHSASTGGANANAAPEGGA